MIDRSDTELAAKGKIPIVRPSADSKRGLPPISANAPVNLIDERTASGEGER